MLGRPGGAPAEPNVSFRRPGDTPAEPNVLFGRPGVPPPSHRFASATEMTLEPEPMAHTAPEDSHMTKPIVHRALVALNLPSPVPLLIAVARAILLALTGNASFPNPTPTLVAFQAAIVDLENAESAAQTRAKGAAQVRDGKRTTLLLLLDGLRSYVQTIADADKENGAALIHSAGMGLRKIPVHAPRVFRATMGGVSGSVQLVNASAGRGASYDWESSTDGGKTWQVAPSTTRARTLFTGLAPATTVMFRSRALTKAGEGDWTTPISFVVQ
jgi:hypothetical protein